MDWAALPAIGAVFLLAGAVKGMLGFGLPMVALGLLTLALDVTAAVSLLIFPALATNLWQALGGGAGAALLRRLRVFLFFALVTIGAGSALLTHTRAAALALGAIMMTTALLAARGVYLRIPPAREGWLGALFGAINGFFTGMTGSFTFPGVLFLQGLGLQKDELVQGMGILFVLSTVVLAAVLAARGLLTADANVLSAIAALFAAAGMQVGRRLRARLSEARFRRLFFAGLFALGAGNVAKALL